MGGGWEGAVISIAGMSSDHTEAATITPEAKPSSDFWSRGDISSRMRKTNAAPSMVPNKGMSSPIANAIYALLNFSLGCLQRGQCQSSGRSSKATPSCSAGSYT